MVSLPLLVIAPPSFDWALVIVKFRSLTSNPLDMVNILALLDPLIIVPSLLWPLMVTFLPMVIPLLPLPVYIPLAKLTVPLASTTVTPPLMVFLGPFVPPV